MLVNQLLAEASANLASQHSSFFSVPAYTDDSGQ